MKVSKILTRYASDSKDSSGTDKNYCKKFGHCYGLVYDHIFNAFDRHAKLDIVEIGTEYGISLLAWKEYFPKAKITGIDIVDKVEKKHPKIKYIISDVKKLKFDNMFDIVIDDGSHKMNDVLYTVQNFRLKVGGVMIIEDCQAPKHWYKAIKKRTRYSIEAIDLRKVHGQRDDFLIVLRNYGYY